MQCRASQSSGPATTTEGRPNLVRLLLDTFLFGDLSPAAVRPLAEQVLVRRYRRGEYIMRPGEPSVALYVLISGQLKEGIPTPAGDELVNELYTAGDVFGEAGLFSRDRARIVSVVALEDSDVASVGRDALIEFLLRHPPATLRMLQCLAEYVRGSAHELANAAFRPIRERLALQLLELAEAGGQPARSVRLSQTTLAALIGATRENVNRSLARLAADGYISMVGNGIKIVDADGLRSLGAMAAPLLPPPNRPRPNGAAL